jgi:hypothetical protein
MPAKFKHLRIGTFFNLVVGAIFVGAAVVLVILVNAHMKEQALVEAESKARLLLDRNLATHTYFSHNLKPSLFAWTEPFRPADYFDPTWMSSTYAVREIDGYFQTLNPANYYYKEAAVNARSPQNEADAFEQTFLDKLNADPDLIEQSLIRTVDGEPTFVTLRRGEVMEESCLRCHDTPARAPGEMIEVYGPDRSFNRAEGDVVSAISIRVPLADAYAEAKRFSTQLSGLLLILLMGLFGVQYGLNRRLLFAPLSRIRQMAQQISTGGHHLGEQIPLPSGRELSDLTAAFNTMSVALRQNQDRLEERVEERTVELHYAVEQLRHEIAEREQTERALEGSNRRLQKALDELRETQKQMMRQERTAAVGQLAVGIAHEFNTLMTSIILQADIMRQTAHLTPKDHGRLTTIREQGHRAAKLTRQILDFGGRAMLKPQELVLVDFLKKVGDSVKQTLPRDIRFSLDCRADGATIYADPERLEEALRNLIDNAQIAMPEGGHLRIDLSQTTKEEEIPCAICGPIDGGNWARIAVTDTGTGIPPEVLPRIFEPFFTTRVPEGSGLGLAQVYGLVKQHQGHVGVQTEEGQGSTFALYLPLSQPQAPQDPDPERAN